MNLTKIKIISGGKPYNTYVETEDGQRLKGVTHVQWGVSVDSVSRAVITFLDVECSVTTKACLDRPPKVIARTLWDRWAEPLLHPVTVPFEPWVKTALVHHNAESAF